MTDAPSDKLKKIGDFPTPYGVTVPVYENPESTETYLFDLPGTLTLAGIHDQKTRDRCLAAFKARGTTTSLRLDVIREFGGGPAPKRVLEKPQDPAYPRVSGHDADIPIEEWVTAIMDVPSWPDRSAIFLNMLASNVEGQRDWAVPIEIKTIPLMVLLTASLEHLCEDEIECIEAAAFYALAEHGRWSQAGVEWLRPYRRTWFRDWALARPQWQEFARMARTVNRELPVWIVKGTSA